MTPSSPKALGLTSLETDMSETKIDDGGSAFPQQDLSSYGIGPSMMSDGDTYDIRGMSLRDWFAGHALLGLGTWMPRGFDNLNSFDAQTARARWAYSQADAMLAERAKATGASA